MHSYQLLRPLSQQNMLGSLTIVVAHHMYSMLPSQVPMFHGSLLPFVSDLSSLVICWLFFIFCFEHSAHWNAIKINEIDPKKNPQAKETHPKSLTFSVGTEWRLLTKLHSTRITPHNLRFKVSTHQNFSQNIMLYPNPTPKKPNSRLFT